MTSIARQSGRRSRKRLTASTTLRGHSVVDTDGKPVGLGPSSSSGTRRPNTHTAGRASSGTRSNAPHPASGHPLPEVPGRGRKAHWPSQRHPQGNGSAGAIALPEESPADGSAGAIALPEEAIHNRDLSRRAPYFSSLFCVYRCSSAVKFLHPLPLSQVWQPPPPEPQPQPPPLAGGMGTSPSAETG